MSEYEPGTVVMLRPPSGREFLAVYTRGEPNFWSAPKGWPWTVDINACTVRPLVVIDPEDYELVREVVQRSNFYRPGEIVTQLTVALQRGLRAMVTPPKPAEPEGVAAVVKDASGCTYIRVSDRKRPWLRVGTTNCVHWDEIDDGPVRVLTEGVAP